jgi:hypothetical protein
MAMMLVGAVLTFAGCGGDNLDLCDGCPTPSVTVTPSVTPSGPTVTATP